MRSLCANQWQCLNVQSDTRSFVRLNIVIKAPLRPLNYQLGTVLGKSAFQFSTQCKVNIHILYIDNV